LIHEPLIVSQFYVLEYINLRVTKEENMLTYVEVRNLLNLTFSIVIFK
jgi:hypothetical protein